MISWLEGSVVEVGADSLVLNVGGVGYGLAVPISAVGSVRTGATLQLWVYEHIREVSHDLYGFTDKNGKAFFEQLLSVNGVGPKMALSLMNIGSSAQLANAISSGEVKYVQRASGVGKRLAERVVVDLKDKVGLPSDSDAVGLIFGDVSESDEAVQALVALGHSPADAARALQGVDAGLSTQERIKQALQA